VTTQSDDIHGMVIRCFDNNIIYNHIAVTNMPNFFFMTYFSVVVLKSKIYTKILSFNFQNETRVSLKKTEDNGCIIFACILVHNMI